MLAEYEARQLREVSVPPTHRASVEGGGPSAAALGSADFSQVDTVQTRQLWSGGKGVLALPLSGRLIEPPDAGRVRDAPAARGLALSSSSCVGGVP